MFYMNKVDLALNNSQWLICHKTKQNLNLSISWQILRLPLNRVQKKTKQTKNPFKKNSRKNVNMNVQWTWLPNLLAYNKLWQVDMPLKSFNQLTVDYRFMSNVWRQIL